MHVSSMFPILKMTAEAGSPVIHWHFKMYLQLTIYRLQNYVLKNPSTYLKKTKKTN